MSQRYSYSSFDRLSMNDPELFENDFGIDDNSSSWSAEAVMSSNNESPGPINVHRIHDLARASQGKRGLKLKSLLPLILTLQDSLVTVDDEHRLLGDVSEEELLKFRAFAACVDCITIAAMHMRERKVANATYMRIRSLLEPQTSPLFPSLSNIAIQYTEATRFYLPLFVSPSLRSFTFHGSGTNGIASLTSYVSMIGGRGCDLSTLHLSGIVLKAPLVEAIASCLLLESVRLTNILEEFASSDRILTLPHLRHLHIDCEDDINLQMEQTLDPPKTSITTLTVSAPFSAILSILDSLRSNKDLKKLVITVTSKKDSDEFSVWYIIDNALLPIIQSSKKTLQTLKVRGAHQFGAQNDCPPSGLIAKLARNSQIRTLHFSNLFIRDIFEHFHLFPSSSTLTDLRLPISTRSRPLTNLELATLAVSCPELSYLQAVLEPPSIKRWSTLYRPHSHANPTTFPRLLILSAGSHRPEERIANSPAPSSSLQDTCALMHCFLMVLPALTEVKTHEGFLQDDWEKIGMMVDLVRGHCDQAVNVRRSVFS